MTPRGPRAAAPLPALAPLGCALGTDDAFAARADVPRAAAAAALAPGRVWVLEVGEARKF